MIPLPYLGQNRYKISWKERLTAFGIVGLILFLITLFVLEIPFFSRTFDVKMLVIVSLLIGLAIGLAIGYLIRTVVYEVHERFAVILMVAIPMAIFTPTIAHLSNRLLPRGEAQNVEIEYLSAEARVSERFGVQKGQEVEVSKYIIHFLHRQEVKKFQSHYHPFPKAQRGDKVGLPVQKGLWGFEFVALRE
ncbi:MAG: hypothetical protein AAF990_21385 [Bacteroidota bacterium]